MRVVVAAWAGAGNLGDELLLHATCSLLRTVGATPVVLTVDPRETRALHEVEASPHTRTWRTLDGVQALVFGGGGLVQDTTSALSPAYQMHRPWLATRRAVPVVGLGLGANPLRYVTSRWLVHRGLGAARTVVARDAPSRDVLRGLGLPDVRLGADLAFTLPPPTSSDATDQLLVLLRPRFAAGGLLPGRLRRRQDDEGAFAAAVASQLDAASRATGLQTTFLSMEPRRDDPLHAAVADRMRTEASWARPGLDDLLGTFARARVVVATRYHGGVGATLAGRPSVLLTYAAKVSSLASELGDATVTRDHSLGGVETLAADIDRAAGIDPAAVVAARERLRQAADVNRHALAEVLAGVA